MRRKADFIYDVLDFIAAIILILISLPLFIFTVLLVKLDSPGPVFYLQERYGKNKRRFLIYKFRTMKQGAENGCPIWGNEADPRASAIGKFLRVSHIDELPQLVNVLRGEMSLVGPRPERPYFAERFENSINEYGQRHSIKPGITGWSQVNGLRGDSSIEERTEYDVSYVNKRSLPFYFKVLLLTPFAKPVKAKESYCTRDFSHTADDASADKTPLIVPIKNA